MGIVKVRILGGLNYSHTTNGAILRLLCRGSDYIAYLTQATIAVYVR